MILISHLQILFSSLFIAGSTINFKSKSGNFPMILLLIILHKSSLSLKDKGQCMTLSVKIKVHSQSAHINLLIGLTQELVLGDGTVINLSKQQSIILINQNWILKNHFVTHLTTLNLQILY